MTNNAIYLSKTASIPFEDRFRNVVLLGPPSSKKREKVIIPMIRQDVEYNKDAGMLVLDADGALSGAAAQMAKQAERPFLFVDPSRDNCPFFNPMVGEESEVIDDLLTVFGDLLADLPPYIRAVNEILLSNAIKVLKRLDREEGVDGKYATFLNLNILLRNINQGGRKLVQMFSQTQKGTDADVKENADIATWFINEYYAENSKTYDTLRFMSHPVCGSYVELKPKESWRIPDPDPDYLVYQDEKTQMFNALPHIYDLQGAQATETCSVRDFLCEGYCGCDYAQLQSKLSYPDGLEPWIFKLTIQSERSPKYISEEVEIGEELGLIELRRSMNIDFFRINQDALMTAMISMTLDEFEAMANAVRQVNENACARIRAMFKKGKLKIS